MTPDEKHIRRINGYLSKINTIYSDLVMQIALAVVKVKISEKLFRFKDYARIIKAVNDALNSYNDNLLKSIYTYSEYEWDFANAKVDTILTENLKGIKSKVPAEKYNAKMREISKQSQNKKAFEEFQKRKVADFTISDRVWNITKQAKENLEYAIDVSLADGTSAQELARKIKSNLNSPDKLFRRVRDKHGNLKLSENALTFHPGQGVYRSAHKNALRLAANEINVAYRTAEQVRIEQNPDVVGVRISLSNSHKITDMCDDLKGIYPKDFKWHSWHPQCRCIRTTILKTPEEVISEINNDEEKPASSSKNYVGSAPKNFHEWVKGYEGKKTPYFVSENRKFGK